MPWKECSPMSLRQEFVMLASSGTENMTRLCDRFGITRKTGYKWLGRYRQKGTEGLKNGSRRPVSSPTKTADAMERAVLELRNKQPAWGGRKLHHRLKTLGHKNVPASSTITDILHRHGMIDPAESLKHKSFQRFEHKEPNDLWQMDFKGHFAMRNSDRCHPLTVLDDHSRFSLALRACANERGETVQQEMIVLFRRYGLPRRMLMDNGSPWGSDVFHPYTPLTAWLMRLGVRVSHGRPYHPQTQGKEERFHRTLEAELLRGREFTDLRDCQERFDPWRDIYNLERPHQALDMKTPASRYRCSETVYPESLPAIEYGPDDKVRKVQSKGEISVEGRCYVVSKAFRGYPIGLRPTEVDGCFEVYFCSHKIGSLDVRGDLGRSDAFALPNFARCARSVRQGESGKP